MKKWILGLLLFIGLLILAVYIFIPAKMEMSESILVRINSRTAYRFLLDENNWTKWLSKPSSAPTSFRFNDTYITLEKKLVDAFALRLDRRDKSAAGVLKIIPIGTSGTYIQWDVETGTGGNPIQKLQDYFAAKAIGRDVEAATDHLKQVLEQPQNVYGFAPKAEKVKDTVLLSTRFETEGYPATDIIYQHIYLLRQYIADQNAKETNHPMLNVQALDSNRYRVMVAIPTDRKLPGAGAVELKRMVPGNILVAEVKGGVHTVEQALRNFDLFIEENKFDSPAIPFASLVTDRTKEKDTAKWITRLYYPVL